MTRCKKNLFALFALWVSIHTFAQNNTLSGTVKDVETGAPLPAANVVVLNGNKTLKYGITNKQGEFNIQLQETADTMRIVVSMLGYMAYAEKIGEKRLFDFHLTPEPIELKEVTIRRGRVWGRSDTIKYDASQFLRGNDKTVEDLMKRLPGIDVDENGNIRYKGKNIGNVYVEGLDLMDSRYKTITKNLSAKSVKTVEVLDNHQRIKSLAGKVPSDIADINLKLKDDFKDKWNFNSKVAAGYSPDKWLYELESNAVQIAKSSQSLYGVKFSNTGNGITKESDQGFSALLSVPEYRLLPENAVSAPLKEPRWLFDNAATLTANRLYKTSEDARLKLNAYVTRDDISQERSATTTYFNPENTLTINEITRQRVRKNAFDFSADYENNVATHYLRNKLEFLGEIERSENDISGSYNLTQQQKDCSFSIKDNLSFTKQLKDGSVLQGQSAIGFWQRDERLIFSDYGRSHYLRGLFFQAQTGVRVGKTKIAQNYSGGISTDFNTIQANHSVWITPEYEYLWGALKINGGLPVSVTFLPEKNRTLLLPKATLRLDYKINYAWRAWLSGKYGRELGSITDFYAQPYFSNYRTEIQNENGIPLKKNLFGYFQLEYKNTLKEFFFTFDAFLAADKVNHTIEQQISADKIFRFIRRNVPHNESSHRIKAIVSKGFFDLHSKTSLEFSWSSNKSAQIRNGEIAPFEFTALSLSPKLSVSPTPQTEVAYEARFFRNNSSFGRENDGTALWNMNQKLSFYYTYKKFTTSISSEHFRNEISEKNSVNLFYLDASATLKLKKVSLTLAMKNLLNQTKYAYTLYNPLSVYSSEISLRPREVLLTAYFSF